MSACGFWTADVLAVVFVVVGIYQSYISKGISPQGIGSFVGNSYVSRLCPVVICPYLRISEFTISSRTGTALALALALALAAALAAAGAGAGAGAVGAVG